MTDHLRIVHFHAENVKKLRVVDFVPDSHVVVVAGDNAQGKTAVLLDGSLLDEQSMATVRAMAEQHDFQVWIERVEKDGASIIIEDGQVAE